MSSFVDRHNVRSLALNIVMKPVPTVELRRLNHSLFMVLKVEWTLGAPKSLGLNWNRQNLYIRNGMNFNNTCPWCSSLSRSTCYLEEENMSIWGKWNWRIEIVWASMREDLSSGFTTMQDLNQPAQLQRVHVARKLKFCVYSKFINYNNKGEQQRHWPDCVDV